MKRDERSLKWAKVNGYKYVECDDEGNIKGYGFSRQTLEYHNEKNLNIFTIRQYEKATKEEKTFEEECAENYFEFKPNRSFEERCEIVRRTAITTDMTYEERLEMQKRRYGL